MKTLVNIIKVHKMDSLNGMQLKTINYVNVCDIFTKISWSNAQ